MKRVTEISSKVNQGESKFFLESWNQKAKDSFLKKEFKKVFDKNQDNEGSQDNQDSNPVKKRSFKYLPSWEEEPFYTKFTF